MESEIINTILMVLLVIAYVEVRLMGTSVKMKNKIDSTQKYFLENLKKINERRK